MFCMLTGLVCHRLSATSSHLHCQFGIAAVNVSCVDLDTLAKVVLLHLTWRGSDLYFCSVEPDIGSHCETTDTGLG